MPKKKRKKEKIATTSTSRIDPWNFVVQHRNNLFENVFDPKIFFDRKKRKNKEEKNLLLPYDKKFHGSILLKAACPVCQETVSPPTLVRSEKDEKVEWPA